MQTGLYYIRKGGRLVRATMLLKYHQIVCKIKINLLIITIFYLVLCLLQPMTSRVPKAILYRSPSRKQKTSCNNLLTTLRILLKA
jgi:hypothetical protein